VAHRQRGAATTDFVLAMIVLMPIFFGIIQLGLTILVRNTLAACASDAARYGAVYGRPSEDSRGEAQRCVQSTVSGRWVTGIQGRPSGDIVVVDISAKVPPLGLIGPGFGIHVSGHAVKEHG